MTTIDVSGIHTYDGAVFDIQIMSDADSTFPSKGTCEFTRRSFDEETTAILPLSVVLEAAAAFVRHRRTEWLRRMDAVDVLGLLGHDED